MFGKKKTLAELRKKEEKEIIRVHKRQVKLKAIRVEIVKLERNEI